MHNPFAKTQEMLDAEEEVLFPPKERHSLRDKAHQLMTDSGYSLDELSRMTGYSKTWIWKFSRKELPNPAVGRIQFLYEFFSGKELEL